MARSITSRLERLGEDDRSFTREEVVAAVKARGYQFNKGILHSWEYLGVLPRAERRRFRGATRSVYRKEIVDTIESVYLAKAAGVKLNTLTTGRGKDSLRDILNKVNDRRLLINARFEEIISKLNQLGNT